MFKRNCHAYDLSSLAWQSFWAKQVRRGVFMELISVIEDFYPLNNTYFLEKADRLHPVMHHSIVKPMGAFRLKERYSLEKSEIKLDNMPQFAMGKGENLCLDFGNHYVGYVSLDLSYSGSHPDAPAFLKLQFAEVFKELGEKSDDYDGWISKSWIQEEYIHVDYLPGKITLPRRYAFRYLKITVLDTSSKYKLIVRHAECKTETSADRSLLTPFVVKDPLLSKIYDVSLRTLENCMQSVFEDGPKRDQRLWVGDFRLQALVNYVSFKNYNLVKRCLYLFAGSRFPDGRVSACIFTKPAVEADDTYLFDYALLYPVILEEYLQETDDQETLHDLYDIAMQQITLSLQQCDSDYIISNQAEKSTFVDWCEGLDKTACAQAILIYAIGYAVRLAKRKDDLSQADWLTEQLNHLRKAAREHFWCPEKKRFISAGQISAASQVWMVLAGVLEPEEMTELMNCSGEFLNEYPLRTPYMHHYYAMALIESGLKEKAMEHMKAYWGSMVNAGADTFWETWTPDDPDASPYGGSVVNSCCHAWSCTPAYMMRRLL